jgi:hypothetical protein
VTDILGGVREIKLQDDFIGMLDPAGVLSIKRGINGTRFVVGTYPTLSQYRLYAEVPTPPTRTTVASYNSGRTACAAAPANGCYSPKQAAVPVPYYGRFCGGGIPTPANESYARNNGPLDGLDQLCRHHDSASLWYSSSTGAFDACVVKYGLVHARLTRGGSLLDEGSADWTSAWATMPDLRDATTAYGYWTDPCTSGSLSDFAAATAARM